MKHHSVKNTKSGFVMVISLALIFIISLIAASLYRFAKSDIDILENQMASMHAYNGANAGLKYGLRKLENWLDANDLNQPDNTGALFPIAAPANASFKDIQEFKILDTARSGNNYVFSMTVTGTHDNAEAVVTATFIRPPVFSLGIFGDLSVDVKPNVDIYSYNACNGDVPNPLTSTGEADLGSNNEIIIGSGSDTDGQVVIGADSSGNASNCRNCGSQEVTDLGETIDPDPMGIMNGQMASVFLQMASPALNSNHLVPEIHNNVLNERNVDITLPSGNYYLEEFYMRGGTLTIDNSAGPVVLFLTGSMESWPAGQINASGDPTDFMILSNSSDEIKIRPRSSFSGIVIAPDAEIRMLPNGDFHGTLWGSEVSLFPEGTIYVDTCLQDRLLKKKLNLVSWKEERGI